MNGCGRAVIETDEQVGRNAHHFKEYENLENVGSHHHTQHREGEQRQERIIALESLLSITMMVAHIAQTIEMHKERNGGNHNEHHRRNGIELKTNVCHHLIAQIEPFPISHDDSLTHTIHHLSLTGAKEIGESHPVCQYGGNTLTYHAKHTGQFTPHFHTCEP